MKNLENTLFSNEIISKISWLGYDFARAIFPDKFPYQAHYSSYSDMVEQEEKGKKIKDRNFANKYIKVLSAGSIQLQMGKYSTAENLKEKISEIEKYDFNCDL